MNYWNKPKKERDIKIIHEGKEYNVKVFYKGQMSVFLPNFPEEEELIKEIKATIIEEKYSLEGGK